jgi:hypothetical protein
LIDFGETVDVLVENIFSIINEDIKTKIYSIPALAFQCTIAKIRPATNGKLESNWSDEANEIFKIVENSNGVFYGKVKYLVIFFFFFFRYLFEN